MAKLWSKPEFGSASSHPRKNAGIASGLASSRVREAGSGPHGESCKPPPKTKNTKKTEEKIKKTEITKLRVATWNVGTLKP